MTTTITTVTTRTARFDPDHTIGAVLRREISGTFYGTVIAYAAAVAAERSVGQYRIRLAIDAADGFDTSLASVSCHPGQWIGGPSRSTPQPADQATLSAWVAGLTAADIDPILP